VRNSILGHIDGWPRGVSGINPILFIFIFFLKSQVKSFLFNSY